jgi:hypothetical protein
VSEVQPASEIMRADEARIGSPAAGRMTAWGQQRQSGNVRSRSALGSKAAVTCKHGAGKRRAMRCRRVSP